MKAWLRTVLLAVVLIAMMSVPATHGQDPAMTIDPKIIEVSNQIMRDIFAEMKQAQPKYKELSGLSERHLSKNVEGIYALKYQYAPQAESEDPFQQDLPYAVGLTIEGLEQWTFSSRKGMFNYGFPLLNLKISGYEQKHPIRTQFNIDPLVKKYGQILADEQQKLMPLQITIAPLKESFKTGEDVVVDIILKNVSKRHMYVRPLNKDTLYFLIDDQYWGTKPTEGSPNEVQRILYSGEEMRMQYRIGVFQQTQTVHMVCFYRMAINGVNPFGKKEISIVKLPQ